MKRMTSVSSLALMALAVPALAASPQTDKDLAERSECVQDIRAMYQDWHQNNDQTNQSLATDKELKHLRRAATVLARNDKEDACREVMSSMEEIAEQRRAEAKDRQSMDKDAHSAAQMDENADQRRRAGMRQAAQIDSMIAAGRLQDADVRNRDDNYLGDIEGVLVSPGEGISYLLVSRGGFLDIGDDIVPVRWNDVAVSATGDVVVLPVSEEVFDQAPSVELEEYAVAGDVPVDHKALADWWHKNGGGAPKSGPVEGGEK